MVLVESQALLEKENVLVNACSTRTVLQKFDRSKILEIYFLRLDGRTPENISSDYLELYSIELNEIKEFLLGQHPHDALLQKVFRLSS